jgi:ketosteroid isomerase-like protein
MEALSTDITDDIKSLNQTFVNCFNQGDTAGVANLYSITALLMPAGSDVIKGREAIGQFWQNAKDNGVTQMMLETVEVEQLELTAIELGTYTLKGHNGTVMNQGKYMAVWKRENDHWKMQKDIWNSNQAS